MAGLEYTEICSVLVSNFVEATARRKLSSNTACERSVIDLVQQDNAASTGLGSNVTLIQLKRKGFISPLQQCEYRMDSEIYTLWPFSIKRAAKFLALSMVT